MKKKILTMLTMSTVLVSSVLPAMAATEYTTSEEKVNSTDTITADADSNICTIDVRQASTFSVIIPKSITLNGTAGSENSSAYTVSVTGNIASNETVTVAPDATTKLSNVNNNSETKDVIITQEITKFMRDETSATGTIGGVNTSSAVKATGKVEVKDLTAGSWAGQFNFKISLTHPTN